MSVPIESTLLVLTILCIVANGFEVAAKCVRAPFVMQNSGEVGVAPHWIPYLAAAEGAGVLGLGAGLVGPRVLGLLAAIGLLVFFVGAIGAHLRARAIHNIVFPGVFLVLAIAATAYFALPSG